MRFDFEKNREWSDHLVMVSQLGLTMVLCIGFCFFIGLYLDRSIGTKGIFTVVFILLGVFGGGVTIYRQIIRMTESDTASRKTPDDSL
ncbi:MAG: AtpZ/AtpI family protein, partial [Desulfobacterales bacterium]